MQPAFIDNLIYFIDLLGTVVFAFSGVLVAGRLKMDIIGVLVLAAVTSIGGGTIRDLLIGATPVFWIKDSHYLLTIALTGVVGMGVARVQHRWPWYVLPLLDAVGLALFVVIGAQKALSYGTSGVIAVIMGCITGVAGGVVRDILAREIPMVLRKEVYVTACLLSGSIYVLLLEWGMGHVASMFVSMLSLLCVRVPAIFLHLSLPAFHLGKDE
nr:trimeric intracellular cation channel family protein [uncultured Tolumonas sp.]